MNKLKILLMIIIFISGCGNRNSESGAQSGGFYFDQTYIEEFRFQFESVKECTKLENGNFYDLTVIVMPRRYKCSLTSTGMCGGEFTTPSIIKISYDQPTIKNLFYVWRHEVIHFLLFINTGDLDKYHTSWLFDYCSPIGR